MSVNIHGSGDIQYGISTDCDWLITESDKGEGTGSIKVTALANKGAPRKGTITVSETAGSLVLQNILTVTQLADGMNVGIGGWDQGNDDGGTAD